MSKKIAKLLVILHYNSIAFGTSTSQRIYTKQRTPKIG